MEDGVSELSADSDPHCVERGERRGSVPSDVAAGGPTGRSSTLITVRKRGINSPSVLMGI